MSEKDQVYTKKTKNYGTFRTDKYPTAYKILCICGCVMFFSFALGSFIGFIAMLSSDSAEYSWFLLLMGACHFGFGCYFIYFTKNLDVEYDAFLEEVRQLKAKEKAEKQAFEKEHPHYEEELFYKACKKANINNVSDKANVARLELVAKKSGISGTTNELINMYTIGKNDIESSQKASRLEKEQQEEQELYKSSKKYINYVGREKKIKMLKDSMKIYADKLIECKNKLKAIDDGTFGLYKAGEEKESDWALWGGIAEGLGGSAAGLATAIDIQNKNAQIRANNDALLKNSAALAVSLKTQVYDDERIAEKQIEYYKKQIEETEIKLIDDSSPKELLNHLNPSATLKVSETGAVKITVKTSETVGLKIYDSVSAVVDGTIKVNLLKGGKKVGQAYATLPVDGSKYQNTINTICISPKESANDYTVSFEPYKLWAIEK